MTTANATLTELPEADDVLELLRHKLNRGVMVQWINHDLINRGDCDVRKSIVLWDGNRDFVMALSTAITPDMFRERVATMPNLFAAMHRAGIRYWSVGIR